jgi:hypothetical protein
VMMSLRARRLARLRDQLPAAFGDTGRRWLLAIAVIVSVAAGSTDAASVIAADVAVAEIVA